jgi:hypothetical protein
MLDYILGRELKVPSSTDAAESGSGSQRLVPDESAKQAALLEADGLAGDEAAAVAFILQCGFADARLRAAEHVRVRPLLDQVLQAMRKLDRRVAKLMQARIDAISKQELIAKHAQDCILDAQSLLQNKPLMLNRVVDIDRNWRSVGEVGDQQRATFESLRREIDECLSAQALLQRSVLDAIDELRALNVEVDARTPEQVTEALTHHDQRMAEYRSAPEVSSLPKNLLAEYELEYQRLKDRQANHEVCSSATIAREEMLAKWESTSPSSLNINELKRVWSTLPASSGDSVMASLQKRFDALLKLVPLKTAKDNAVPIERKDMQSGFSQVLEAMESALQEGLLHVAAEQDEILRSPDMQSQGKSNSLTTRLGNARAELKRLQGWAKWGGNVSREELIKAVEELPAQKLSIQELTKKLGSSRERWKSLDTASGAAPKSLWERFDSACNTAYVPVAEQSRRQAQERQQNKDKAQLLIAELRRFVDAAGLEKHEENSSESDWKKVANFQRSTLQSWQRIGHMDRKDKKRIDAEFDSLMQTLMAPLRRKWQIEIERRERMIQEVEQISINDRKAIDRVRAAQEQWQKMAKSLPLERKDDQALWQRFRVACNAVFAQRKETAIAADAQRQQNAAAREALYAELESARPESESATRKLLRETEAALARIGPVPRAKEQHLDERYRKVVAKLRMSIETAKTVEREAQGRALFEKFSLCRAAESALVANLPADPAWEACWQALPRLHVERENIMRRRFDTALKAFVSGGREYAATLERNSAILQQELLRVEILAGIDSPSELSRQRMQMQMQVLQSSLSGQKVESFGARIDKLCGLAALVDEQSLDRVHGLLKRE